MTSDRRSELPAFFYKTVGGAEPVLEWMRSLPRQDRRAIGEDLATVQVGWPIGMPVCRPLGGGLWKVRGTLPSSIARLVFSIDEGRIAVAHGFIKKNAKTPLEDLLLARKWMQEMKT